MFSESVIVLVLWITLLVMNNRLNSVLVVLVESHWGFRVFTRTHQLFWILRHGFEEVSGGNTSFFGFLVDIVSETMLVILKIITIQVRIIDLPVIVTILLIIQVILLIIAFKSKQTLLVRYLNVWLISHFLDLIWLICFWFNYILVFCLMSLLNWCLLSAIQLDFRTIFALTSFKMLSLN